MNIIMKKMTNWEFILVKKVNVFIKILSVFILPMILRLLKLKINILADYYARVVNNFFI